MNRDLRAALLSAVASLLTLLVLSPLLEGRSWLQPVVLVVVAVGLVGSLVAVAGLPRWSAPPLGVLAGLVITTALLVPAQAAVGGFVPTPTSLRALLTLVRAGVRTTNEVGPPAVVDAGIIALLTVAAGLLVLLVSLVAGPLRRPGAAGLPLLLVICVGTALAPGGIGLQGYLLAGVGYLGLALTDAGQRVGSWGQVLTRPVRAGARPSTGVTESFVRPAAVAAVGALAVGAFVPLVLPGSTGGRLQELVDERFGGSGSGGLTTLNPFLDIREDLLSQSEAAVLRYETEDPDPDPLRILTADEFDGAIWGPSQIALDPSQRVGTGLPLPPGASTEVLQAAPQVLTTVTVDGLDQSYLPLPYPASSIEVPGEWLYDPTTLNVVSPQESTAGLRYAVTSYDIAPSSAQLAGAPTEQVDPRWTEVPEDVRDVVLPAAQEVLAVTGPTTRYEQALALQQWFRSGGGFTYSLDAPDSTDGEAVAAFLEQRRGYCVQFASTMTLMARSLGIPSRVAVGFLPGEETAPGSWQIRAADAHAWPELYFEGTGWVRFEPTPGTRTGPAPAWAVPEPSAAPVAPQVPAPSAEPAPQPLPTQQEPGSAVGPGAESDRVLTAERVAVGLGALALLVTALGLPRWWRSVRSRRRRAMAGDDSGRVAAVAWLELSERLADLGASPRGATMRTCGADLVRHQQLDDAQRAGVARLVDAAERASYAAVPAPADDLEDDVRSLLAHVRGRVSRSVRLRATWWPTLRPGPQEESGSEVKAKEMTST